MKMDRTTRKIQDLSDELEEAGHYVPPGMGRTIYCQINDLMMTVMRMTTQLERKGLATPRMLKLRAQIKKAYSG